MSLPVARLDQVWFSHGSYRVLQGVSLDVHAGEYLAILGPNGAGKSSLIRVMLGLERPQMGRVQLFGEEVSRFRRWQRIGYVPQRASGFVGHFPATVHEVVASGRVGRKGLFGRLTRTDRDAVAKALDAVELGPLADRLVHQLSTGQQQRASLARALAAEPELLVLDEPLAGVDAAIQESIYDLLKGLVEGQGLTVVMVSHDLAATLPRVTRVAYLEHGSLVTETPAAFVRHYPNLACLIDPSAHIKGAV